MSIFELKNIDCLELMKTMADNSVDCIITDPPYFEIAKSRVEKAYYSKNIEIKNDIIDLSEYRPSGESQLRFFK